MRKFSPSAFCLCVLILSAFPFLTWAGNIQTSVTSHWEIKGAQYLDLKLDIQNLGDVKAHSVSVSLLIGSFKGEYTDLGNNPPGGEIQCSDRIDIGHWKPGAYIGLVKVDFEEENGVAHFVYHVFEILIGRKGYSSTDASVSAKVSAPTFNSKAFWDNTNDLGLVMENLKEKPTRLNIRLFLPEGFVSASPGTEWTLSAGEQKTLIFPIRRQDSAGAAQPFHLLIDYELGGRHYARHLQEKIRVLDQPVYLGWYVIFSLATLVLIFLVCLIYRRKRFF